MLYEWTYLFYLVLTDGHLFYFSCFINEQDKQANFFIMSKDFLYPITAEYQ